MTMRAPTLSEPKSNLIIFPTYQVPQESAMRGSAPHHEPVQQQQQDEEIIIARASRGGRADPPSRPQIGGGRPLTITVGKHAAAAATLSVISGSGRGPAVATYRREASAPNLKLQSVTDNCLLNSVTVPKIQRNDRDTVAHNNYLTNNDLSNNNVDRDKVVVDRYDDVDDGDDKIDDVSSKFGALPPGRDIPNQKSDDLEVLDALENFRSTALHCDNNDKDDYLKRTEQHGDYDLCHKQMILRTIYDETMQGLSPPLRLRGGGESSLSTGTSGWGTPPSQQANNNNMNNTTGWGTANPNQPNGAGSQQWNNNANRPPGSSQNDANKTNAGGQQPPTSQSNSAGGWGQPGAKPPQGTNQGAPSGAAAAAPPANNNAQNNPQNANNTNTTKQQLEQLNNMREAIYSTEGWGGHVNQDSQWDIPASPEPPMKMDGSGPPPWKPAVNNGTELWEANLRNGGQPPPQPQQKTPWGHTPSTNIGGTWGEDDDAAESSNVWTGVPNNQQQGWNNNSNTMWGDSNKRVAGAAGNNASGWGDPRAPADPRAAAVAAAAAMEMRPDLRAAAAASGLDPRQLDPREQIRQMTGGDMRGDPRGITGRLNGAGAEFWGQTGPHVGPGAMHHQNKMPVGPGNAGGWEEPSPPTQRRTMPNYDDGTSLWGNPQQGSHWQGMSTGAGGAMGGRPRGGPPGMAPGRKPEGVWGGGGGGAGGAGGGGRNGWDDGPAGAGWGDEPGAPWAKPKGPGGLWDSELDWGHKPQNKPQFTKEQVWNSKQFRMLVDMGFKKDDVENALRMREMNMEEALELLSPLRRGGGDGWGAGAPHDDHFEHNQFPGAAQRFAGLGGPTGNPLGGGGYPPGPGLLNSMGGGAGQPNSSLINNISPAVVQKILSTQQAGGQGVGGFVGSAGGRPMQPQNQPSTQQLRMLVQQIQMAVQAGYLNHQILNQPLAPQTLVLLNQLLQQIKALQQLNSQQQITLQSGKGNANNPTLVQFSVLISKTKQQIINIQNQIQAQQAHYVKQQQQGQIGGYDFKSNPMHDSINALQSNFADLGLNKDPTQQSQSRLNQWINKDKDENSEFSRAPGSSSKPVATSPNMAPIGLTQPDGPWSSGRSGDTGWPDSSGADTTNDVKDAQWGAAAQPSLTDLVPEFEPGKPWKIKSIEDDPSITPGSVVRSPLSIATINVKDNELFGINSSKSPPATDAMQSLSSSTWSFNPPSTSSAFTSPQIKLPTTKGSLGDLNPGTAVTSELWGAPKSRGPPPGLSGKGGSLANGWTGPLGGGGAAPWCGSTNVGQRNSGNWGGSTGGTSQWLLLRNLTAQIDGSTLRTLCMQHGPLLSFHLHLHQGFALAKYSSREEATKAQTALNNCVLGNTTILAENPTDWEANTLLQSIANQQGGNSGGWRSSSTKPGGDTWSTGWSNNPTSLWATTPLDSSDPARATPSSLNSFLPNDLLGGESM
ncbi:protein Gawky isoform X2 [Anthonomus grandis grandis]|uniref:protein Gawky isoform X2 n=1 Tax=Anthonomus grandis grandis TaxID=2921223 RepID=UPI0021653166|nr:protein Gawky isoform X2 [Anthonomus grandis grandis]